MTLIDSISYQLNNLNLVPLEESKFLHFLYADYVELLALFSNGDSVTAVHLISRLEGEGISIIDDESRNDTGDEIGSLNDQVKDKQEAWSYEVFSVISDRCVSFGEKYPFYVDDRRIVLKDALTTIQKIYLMLLLSSSLKYFPKLQSNLTSEFEKISFFALKNYLPDQAKVKQFGKKSDYTGSAIEKIRKLAVDMGLEVDEDHLSDISPQNNQEEGLDLVGWLPFADQIPSMLSVLGQCACGKEWRNKQTETKRYEEFLKFYKVFPIHTLFIPYALGRPNNRFYQSKDINKGSLIFDRKRILELAGEDLTFFNDFDSSVIVQHFIEYEEDTV